MIGESLTGTTGECMLHLRKGHHKNKLAHFHFSRFTLMPRYPIATKIFAFLQEAASVKLILYDVHELSLINC